MSYSLSLTTVEALAVVLAVIAFTVTLALLPIIYSPQYWGERVASAFLEGTWTPVRAINATEYGGYWVSWFVKVVLRNPTDAPVRVVVVALTPKGLIDVVSGASVTGSAGVAVSDPPATIRLRGKALYIPSKGYAVLLRYTGQLPRGVLYCTATGCRPLPDSVAHWELH